MKDYLTVEERFWDKVGRRGPNECWPWLAYRSRKGYGSFRIMGEVAPAHRVAFFLTHGRWPEPCCCHACDVRACCNPAHLWEGRNADNTHDMDAKGRGVRVGQGKGEAHVMSKLTEEMVRVIRGKRGVQSQSELGKAYGIHQSHVSAIQRRQAWSHVP